MKKDSKTFPFDSFLIAYYTGQEQQLKEGLVNKEVETVFEKPVEYELSHEKSQAMIKSLVKELSVDTLGTIVIKGLEHTVIDETTLQEKTGLTPSVVNAIKKDLVFTNSVPVKSLIKMLKMLGVSVEKAKTAIYITFDKLQTESRTFLTVPSNIQPSFRKGMVRGELGRDPNHLKSDESYLYQNKEALDKYTDRLTELYETL